MSENRNPKFEKGDIALYIAPLTAICYGLSFIHRVGEYNYYGIPTKFIELDLNSITVSVLSVFPILIFMILVWHKIFFKIRRPEDTDSSAASRGNTKKRVIVLIVIALTILYLYFSFRLLGYIMLGFVFLSFFATICVIFLIAFYKKRKYLYSLFIGLVLSGTMSYAMGFGSSDLEPFYTIVKDKDKNYLLLETYKDKFILAPVDLEKREFSKKLTLKDINDNYVIFTKRTSMLKPKK